MPPLLVEEAVRAALAEDLGRAGDVTTQAIIPASAQARAAIVARDSGVVAGLAAARAAFALTDPAILFEAQVDRRRPRRAGNADRARVRCRSRDTVR